MKERHGGRSGFGALAERLRTALTRGHWRGPRPAVWRALVIGGIVGLAGLAVFVGFTVWRAHSPLPPPGCNFAATSAGTYSITLEQAQNAAIIAAVAQRKGMPDHAVTIALAASLQETQLRNLPYGDLDSVGLFQQRPSQGWGMSAQIMDPNYAASAFYDHLTGLSGWQTMAVTDAAQLVQHSAAPNAYAAWEAEARSLARALTGEIPAGLTCHLRSFGGLAPPPSALAQAATKEMGVPLLGVALPTKTGWEVATWAVAHAYNYHLSSVSFGGWRWTVASGTWTPVAGLGPGQAVNTVTVT
jgi:hypothetical protein